MSFPGFLRLFSRRSLKDKNKKPTVNDTDSGSSSAATTSASPRCRSSSEYRYEDGRRFHNHENIAYILPDDIEEDDRLHVQHWGIKLAFGSNFGAPVTQNLEHGANVLDSACGPGTWTLEMANQYPNSTVYGIDISSRFPNQIKPRNCEFLVHNIVDELPFKADYFEYIHQRLVILGIKKEDWPKVLQNLKRTLKPGGWIELMEFSYARMQKVSPNITLMVDFGINISTAAGLDPDLGCNISTLLSEAGFINVQTRSVDVPVNHGGKIGQLFWDDLREGLKSGKAVATKMSPQFQEPGAYEKYINDFGEECKIHKWTMEWTRAIAQKPLINEV